MRFRHLLGALGVASCCFATADAQVAPQVLPVSHFDTVSAPKLSPPQVPIEVPTALPSRFTDAAPTASSAWFGGGSSVEDAAVAHPEVSSDCGCGDLGCSDVGCGDVGCGDVGGCHFDGCCCNGPVPVMIGNSLGVPRVLFTGSELMVMPTHFLNVADNNTARTADRFALTYQLMNNVPKALDPVTGALIAQSDPHTFRVSAEKMLLAGNVSMMFTAPMYSTISQDITSGALNEGFEFGRIAFGPKLMLWESNGFVLSTGMQFEAPTNRPISIDGAVLTTNREWHLTPFVAASRSRGRLFTQSFVSYRARTGAEQVLPSFGGPTPLIAHDMLLADAQIGWWMRQRSGRGLTGIAPIVELHYAGNAEREPAAFFSDSIYSSLDQLTLTGGTTLVFNERHSLSLGYGVPLRDNRNADGLSTDRLFDGELTMHLNLYR